MRNKKILFLISLFSILTLNGCGIESDVTINDDKTVTAKSSMYLNENEYSSLGESDTSTDEYEKVNRDGKVYYKGEEDVDKSTWSDMNISGNKITKDLVVLSMSTDNSPLKFDFVDITVKVPFDVKYTNGEIVDSSTIKFNKTDVDNIFISSNDSVVDGKDIKFLSSKSNKELKNKAILGVSDLYYKSSDGTNKCCNIKVDSDDGLVVESFINDFSFNGYSGNNIADKMSVFTDSINNKVKVNAKNGKYTVSAKLMSGSEKSLIYYVDTESPTISVKNNKLKCFDKKKDGYSSGIKSIKVNGKVVKNGVTVKRGNKVVVTDKAGNITKKTIK